MATEPSKLLGQGITAKVTLNNYRFPRYGHESGKYAIVLLRVEKLLEGEIPDDFKTIMGEYVIVATGNMPKLKEGVEYNFMGTLTKNSKYGLQYEVISMHLDYNLDNKEDQRKFFSFFMTDRQIDLLFEQVADPIACLKNKTIEELLKVKGIGPVTARRMCERYEECKDNSRAYVELKQFDLTKRAIDRLINQYGSADVAVEKVIGNPYILIKEVRGYGWKKADEIAKRQGFTNDCKERVLAYAQYYLETQGDQNGNSWVSINDLCSNVAAECVPVSNENLVNWLKEVMLPDNLYAEFYNEKYFNHNDKVEDPKAWLYFDQKTREVGLLSIKILEDEIARHLQRIKNAEPVFKYDKEECQKIIEEVEEEQGFKYTNEQIKAIWMMLDNNISILTGSAGTGKSNTLTAVVRIFDHYDMNIKQCALSGRASSKLTEITGVEGKTIHRLLAYSTDADQFSFNERRPLHDDCIILDEASMVGGELFLSLISAVKNGAKFIMVGDIQQLECIGLCNVLKDCLSSGYIPSVMLSKIHRQAAKSGIISQSLRVSAGEPLVQNTFEGTETRGDLLDFHIIASNDNRMTQENIIKRFKELYFNRRIPAEDIQVLVPMRVRGDISCRALNEVIQSIVNSTMTFNAVTVKYLDSGTKYEVTYKPRDRVIVTRNNYKALTPNGKEVAIFNGNVGYIKDIDIKEKSMTIVLPEQGEVILGEEQWGDIQLGYAITIHKKQGDSIPYAIIGLDTSCYALYSKELIYTAITRARTDCTLVTQAKAINQAVKISRIRTKQTWLKASLKKLYVASMEPTKIDHID